jgi:hypothetical protein
VRPPTPADPQSARSSCDADRFLEERVRQLRVLSWLDASRLPDSAHERVFIGGSACELTTFRQAGVLPEPQAILVTIQLARPRCFGALGDLVEKGLVFRPGAPARLATAAELLESGE